ncbi:MAG: D,D-heptose 1,7-bisphosphate phosphatase [Deltaproteobacteria bacterium]|nr:MAG: D,D-heptose 1,7-bisphosphate phosphatase [Deltaproteobacteria bacterium]
MDLRVGVFLDRDGTINQEVGYMSNPEAIELIPGAARAIRLINCLGLRAVVVSNQSGVARGYFPLSMVEEANRRLELLLAQKGAHLDGIYYCPHRPEDSCPCRKPEPGLLKRAAAELGIDLRSSYMVGDRAEDIETIHRVGGKGILVLTGYGKQQNDWLGNPPDFVARDLLEAVYWISLQEGAKRRQEMAISKELLDILACPKCKGDIVLTEKGDGLICKACKLIYPIKDDIPVMLIEEALPYEEKKD